MVANTEDKHIWSMVVVFVGRHDTTACANALWVPVRYMYKLITHATGQSNILTDTRKLCFVCCALVAPQTRWNRIEARNRPGWAIGNAHEMTGNRNSMIDKNQYRVPRIASNTADGNRGIDKWLKYNTTQRNVFTHRQGVINWRREQNREQCLYLAPPSSLLAVVGATKWHFRRSMEAEIPFGHIWFWQFSEDALSEFMCDSA